MAIVLAACLVLTLAGCFGGKDDAAASEVADWIAEQDGVTSATGEALSEYDTILSLDVGIEPEISDDDLVDLAHLIDDHAAHAGWSQYQIGYHLAEDRAFASLGGDATLQVFLAIRHLSYTQAFARGGGEGSKGFFYISQPTSDGLENELQGLVDIAHDVGGIQSNLEFTAASDDGLFTVSGTYDEAPTAAAAEWRSLAETHRFDKVWALAIETGAQILNVWVPDAETQAAVQAEAALQNEVDVRVYLTE